MEYQELVVKIVRMEQADIVTFSAQYIDGDFVQNDIFKEGMFQ